MKKTSYAAFINSLSLGWKPCPPAPGLEKHMVMFGAVVPWVAEFYLLPSISLGSL